MNQLQRPLYGFLLSLLTAVLWGLLPLGLLLCLSGMDSITITFFRFGFAALIVFIVLLSKRSLPKKEILTKRTLYLITGATVFLLANYISNVIGLRFLNASSAQVVLQLAPFSLMLGGIILYKEHFTRPQLIGALMLIAGLALFFNQRLPAIFESETESVLGIVIFVGSAIVWACYALIQKPLLKTLSAQQLTVIIYSIGALMLLPFSQLSSITSLSSIQFYALVFCCLNTLFAYGAFTEAIRVWYASKVSAVLATQPIFTYISMRIAENIMPESFHQPELDIWAYCGGLLVVFGSIISALGKKQSS
ncbi:DMT family transporter [Alteromonas sp. 5E99-2]|uniref:DMT family transporter n=1 Tax=Alteromonas sp. 5E99-2 TaxID=2817683 RepID=UPI00325AD368